MKRKSTSTDVYYLGKDDLVRRLGISLPYPGQSERVDVVLALNSGQQTLSITITRDQPESLVEPRPAAFTLPDQLVIHEPPLTQKLRPGENAGALNLGASQPGPVTRRPIPRDHSLGQDGPGDSL